MAKIFFCGDVINQFSDTQFVSSELCDIIKECDYSVCNLEGVIAYKNEGFASMKQNYSTAKHLREAGFDLALLANNHITDYGKEALSHTIECLSKHNIAYTGAAFSYEEAYKIHYFTNNEIKYAIINLCEAQGGQYDFASNEFGHAWIGASCIDSIIKEANLQADIVFLCVHAGLEHYQLPLEQFREIYRHYCDLGVDVVIGSHPHIVQGVESYNKSLIFYSLGNFYFPRNPDADYKTDEENQAFSVVLKVDRNLRITYEVIYHKIDNKMVQLTQATPLIDIARLSQMLGDDYNNLIDKQVVEAFYSLPINLLRISLNGISYSDGILQKIKIVVRYLLKRREQKAECDSRMKLLKHVINNETYRYLITSVINKRIY